MSMTTREPFARYTDPETFSKIKEYPSVTAMWEHCLSAYGDTAAICDDGAEYTFNQTEEAAATLRTALLEAQGERTGRVGIYCGNSFEFVRAFLAATTLGYTAVVLPAALGPEAVTGCCMKFGITTLIHQSALADNAAAAAGKCPSLALLPADRAGDKPTAAKPCAPESDCVVMLTGGTTGKSKGCLLSNGAVMQGVVNGCYGYRDVFGQRYLLVLPLSHVFGLIRNLLTSLYTGSTLFICRNPKDMFRDAAAFRPTIWVAVPALAEMALGLSKKFGRNMLGPDLKCIICGAAAVSPYLISAWPELGVTLLPGYGLTESANLVSGNPECRDRPEAVGLLYPNQEYRVDDTGELWLRGANMLTAYLGEDEPAWQDGWFRTGDLVRFDGDGFLYITGRLKEIIVLANGENVSPAEVETHFLALPFVQDCQVFEDVNDSGTHILALEVVPRAAVLARLDVPDPAAWMTAELEKVNGTLPGHQRVNRIVIRDSDFERTPSMKIVRYQKCK